MALEMRDAIVAFDPTGGVLNARQAFGGAEPVHARQERSLRAPTHPPRQRAERHAAIGD
jgi:hypothetical protein